MEKQFKITLNADQVRILSSYMYESIGLEIPAIVDFQAELQQVVDRQIEAYGEAIGDYIPKVSTSIVKAL